MPNRRRLLVLTSTLPRFAGDPEPRFVGSLCGIPFRIAMQDFLLEPTEDLMVALEMIQLLPRPHESGRNLCPFEV
jgi:hypothetical protein